VGDIYAPSPIAQGVMIEQDGRPHGRVRQISSRRSVLEPPSGTAYL